MGPATLSSQTLLIQLILLAWWFIGLFLLATADIVEPDIRSCHHEYGILDRPSCDIAIEQLPRGALPSIFSTREGTMDNMFTLPRIYVDSADRPRCVITIDLDGHSNRNVFVLVPWNKIREMAENILDLCVSSHGFGWGGTVTFGLQRTFDALVHPASYDLDGGRFAVPAEVIQPDGSRGVVAIPPGTSGQHFDVPLYMVVSVSGPFATVDERRSDALIATSLKEEMRRQYRHARDMNTQNVIVQIIDGLNGGFIRDLASEYPDQRPRWWEYTFGAPTPTPANLKYQCEARMGSPSMASCEIALFHLRVHGPVVLDPAQGLIIQQSGNCAISATATEKYATTWDLIRSAAEILLVQCISGPNAGKIGGTAITIPISARRRRDTVDGDATLLPPTFQLSIYLQEPFTGAANRTCAWAAVSAPGGDVRQCPATNGHQRPPDRGLTETIPWGYDNITEVVNGTTLEIKGQNFTGYIQANATDLIADAGVA